MYVYYTPGDTVQDAFYTKPEHHNTVPKPPRVSTIADGLTWGPGEIKKFDWNGRDESENQRLLIRGLNGVYKIAVESEDDAEDNDSTQIEVAPPYAYVYGIVYPKRFTPIDLPIPESFTKAIDGWPGRLEGLPDKTAFGFVSDKQVSIGPIRETKASADDFLDALVKKAAVFHFAGHGGGVLWFYNGQKNPDEEEVPARTSALTNTDSMLRDRQLVPPEYVARSRSFQGREVKDAFLVVLHSCFNHWWQDTLVDAGADVVITHKGLAYAAEDQAFNRAFFSTEGDNDKYTLAVRFAAGVDAADAEAAKQDAPKDRDSRRFTGNVQIQYGNKDASTEKLWPARYGSYTK